jgi:hypothetical protein
MTKDNASKTNYGKDRHASSAGKIRRYCMRENLQVKLEGTGLFSAEEW